KLSLERIEHLIAKLTDTLAKIDKCRSEKLREQYWREGFEQQKSGRSSLKYRLETLKLGVRHA
ncbi:unnamed protein product, partial [marine sediment metagenome]